MDPAREQSRGVSLFGALLRYLVGLLIMAGSTPLLIAAAHWHETATWICVLLLGVLYLVIGIVFSRILLRRLIEWHPVYNTLQGVANSKLKMALFWPLTYPLLFIRLVVVRYL